MDTLSRYLCAVRNDLPKGSARDDIIAEIADDIQSQIEEREGALGRSLTNDEAAAIIKAYGYPRIVAARYAAVPYLIGPEFLPFYWYILRLILTIVVTVELLAGALGAVVASSGAPFFAALGAAWNSAIVIFVVVTVAFAVAERMPDRAHRLARRSPNSSPIRLRCWWCWMRAADTISFSMQSSQMRCRARILRSRPRGLRSITRRSAAPRLS